MDIGVDVGHDLRDLVDDRNTRPPANRAILSWTPVRMLPDCVEASKACHINLPLGTAPEPMKR